MRRCLGLYFVLLAFSVQSCVANEEKIVGTYVESACGVTNLADGPDDKKVHPVVAGNFPWYAAIYHRVDDKWENVCGGTLVTTLTVLTAATCLQNKSPEDVKVAFGKLKREWIDTELSEIKRDVKEVHIPDGFQGNSSHYENNIGLVVLTSEVPSTSIVCVVQDDTPQSLINKAGYVVGWDFHERLPSDASFTPPSSNDLSYVRTSILKHSDCASSLSTKTEPNFHLPSDALCNATEPIPHGKGNVGSGITIVSSKGFHYIYGVVSVIALNGQKSVATYTNVSYHYDWIIDHMS